jgi:hypothetical protein
MSQLVKLQIFTFLIAASAGSSQAITFTVSNEAGEPLPRVMISRSPLETPEADLVFNAGLDGKVRAWRSDSGELMWQTNTAIPFDTVNGVSGHGRSIDVAGQVIAGGWLYILSGYSMFGQLPGNVLLAYRVK